MKLPVPNARHGVVWALSLALIGALLLPQAQAQQKFPIKNVAEKKLKQLPAGPLFWRIENFPTLAQAQAAAGETSRGAAKTPVHTHPGSEAFYVLAGRLVPPTRWRVHFSCWASARDEGACSASTPASPAAKAPEPGWHLCMGPPRPVEAAGAAGGCFRPHDSPLGVRS